MFTRCVFLAAAITALWTSAVFAFDTETKQDRLSGRVISNWHAGPFFEYKKVRPYPFGDRFREDELQTFWAFRPFYSRVHDRKSGALTQDFIWPLGTWHGSYDSAWYRALIAYGDYRDDDPSWSFNVFPLWFSGTDRTGEDYWGLFPLYGNHPHVLFMDDWQFFLWPVWQTYTVKDVRSRSVLWPIVTWRDDPRSGVGVWPLYGNATLRESEHSYALWPIATWASYREDRDTSGAGYSWMFFPVCGSVNRARERQLMFLPPFFSYAETDSAKRWRLPWPFIEILKSGERDRICVLPFYESVDGYSYYDKKSGAKAQERTRRYGWYLVEDSTIETERVVETRFTVFPFWTSEKRYAKKKDGSLVETHSYKRIWPFWCSETVNGKNRQRILELNPIRHSEGIERNWAPFWTFWSCEDRPNGRTKHSVFWNLATWHTDND